MVCLLVLVCVADCVVELVKYDTGTSTTQDVQDEDGRVIQDIVFICIGKCSNMLPSCCVTVRCFCFYCHHPRIYHA